jgi:hypothetical protein
MLDEIGVIHANPAATPRHHLPGENKSAFNNQTAEGATTTSCRPPSPRWCLYTFKDRPATPLPTRHQNTETGQLRNRDNNVNPTTFSTSEALSKGDAN